MTHAVVADQVEKMFGSIANRYDLANTVLSLGIHHIWKRDLIKRINLSKDVTVVDLCTGTGDLLPLLRKRFDRVVGIDFCLPMLKQAADRYSAQQCTVIHGDALRLPFSDSSIDGLTVAFGVRNLENLEAGLVEMHRVLKPGGILAVLEFGQPNGVVFGKLYQFYSRYLMPIVGGILTGHLDPYRYLPETAARFPCGEEFVAISGKVGFQSKETVRYTGGIAYAYLLAR